jgi:pseudouridine synthase
MQIRLQKILAQGTSLSRRAAEDAIKNGDVQINGTVVTKMGTKADPLKDRIALGGKPIRFIQNSIYIIYNKPRNVIVSKKDELGRPTIWDRLHKDMRSMLNSAGRLDFDSEGLLILTNDGALINKLTHPSASLWKVYQVKVRGIVPFAKLEELRHGVKLDDGVTLPAKVSMLRTTDRNATYEVSIQEGRNRQVRKMFDAVGHPVTKLRRAAIGFIRLGTLKLGAWRYMNKKELTYIKSLLRSSS